MRISTRCCWPTDTSWNDCIGIDVEAVFVGEALQLLARLAQRRSQQRVVLDAENDVLENREIVDQHEVLVHHADAELQRMAGIGDVLELAVDEDLAAVGGVEAVEDRHQRRLAGAVLPDDAVDGAAPDLEIDVAVGPRPGRSVLLIFLSSIAKSDSSAPGRALRHVRVRVRRGSRPQAADHGHWLSVV